jgi:vacuolar-type H+-ATPase subunit C/Vma6
LQQLLTISVLDDNTYTNKTWAEVSGISVGEIHVMEVEFLSNMRYSLLASAEQWKEWQLKLGKFGDYFERAMKAATPLHLP